MNRDHKERYCEYLGLPFEIPKTGVYRVAEIFSLPRYEVGLLSNVRLLPMPPQVQVAPHTDYVQ